MRGRRFSIAVLVALALTSAAVTYVESVTHIRKDGGTYVIFGLTVIWAFVIAGLIAWRRRPGNRTGLLMMGIGFAWAAAALTDSPNDVVYTIGLLAGNLWPGLLVHLLLSYPSGRLDRWSRFLVGVTYFITVGLSILTVPFSEPRDEGNGASLFSAHNLLLVHHLPGLITALQVAAIVVAVPLIAAVLWTVWRRWRSASAATRRVLAPLYLTGATAIGAMLLVAGLLEAVGLASHEASFYVFSISFAAVPAGYLFGILRTRLDRSSAVETLLGSINDPNAEGGLRESLQVALNDPTLDVAYRRAGTDDYVDASGERYEFPGPQDMRAVTSISHEGETIAALVHDPVLLDDPELIDAVCAPAALSIENERLAAELRAQFQEVSASERRLRDVLESVQLIAVSVDMEGRITFCNRYFEELTGWKRAELLGEVWAEKFPGSDTEFIQRVRENRVLVHDETRLVTKAGEVREVSWSNTITRDADGDVVGATSIGDDVTERNRASRQEAALRRLATMVAVEAPSEEIFHTLTEDVAHLLGGQTSNLIQFDDLSTGTVVAGWSETDVVTLPVGECVMFDGPTAVQEVRRTGRAARIDNYEGVQGELAERLRRLGLRSTVSAPVVVDGRVWGAIVVSTTGSATLAPDAEAQIVQFSELVAIALTTAEAHSQLEASRARIVAAGDAERRRLERNLHDGAQQRLVSLALGLRMARSAVGDDSDAAALIDSASVELAEALAELRELARGIHPAVLTDQGLRAAVGALTLRAAVPVKVTFDLEHELPQPVEAAIYYVISEALANITKYAGATSAEVSVSSAGRAVRVVVADDGIGGADADRGSGLNGLIDRVDALNGHLHVASPPGEGTRLFAQIPIGVTEPVRANV